MILRNDSVLNNFFIYFFLYQIIVFIKIKHSDIIYNLIILFKGFQILCLFRAAFSFSERFSRFRFSKLATSLANFLSVF